MSLSHDSEVTLPTATFPEHDRLAAIDDLTNELQEWHEALMEAFGDVSRGLTDEASRQRAQDTITRLVQIDGELHKADFDPEWVAEFRGLLLDSLRAMQQAQPLDAFDKLLLDVEAMRHLLRDALDGHVGGSEEDIAAVVGQLQQWLPRASQAELAGLMGISTRQYQRWSQMHVQPAHHAQVVARLIAILRRSWTDAGVVAWFHRPRPELDGKSRSTCSTTRPTSRASSEPCGRAELSMARRPEAVRFADVAFRYSDYDTPMWVRANSEDGRWNTARSQPTQYLGLSPDGCWADLIRRESLRTEAEVALIRMPLWVLKIDEERIADYRTFEQAQDAGFPADALVDGIGSAARRRLHASRRWASAASSRHPQRCRETSP